MEEYRESGPEPANRADVQQAVGDRDAPADRP
jgi:hypothetical protein